MIKAKPLVTVALLVSGCVQGPDFVKGGAPVPETWSHEWSATDPAVRVSRWWEQFDDAELTSLIERSRDNNPDVRVALARIEESRSSLDASQVAVLPFLGASASYNREQPSANGILALISEGSSQAPQGQAGPTVGRVNPPAHAFDLYQTGINSNWTPDLWGRTRRGVEAASAALLASEEGRTVVLGTVATEIGRNYLQLRSAQAQRQVAQEILDLDKRSVELIRSRVASGLSTSIDLANAEAAMDSTKATIPPLLSSEQAYRNAMALLLGNPPGTLDPELSPVAPIPALNHRLPMEVPSELVRRRPDIRQAEASLHQATANIGVAKADFFPQVSLSGSFAFQALQLSGQGGLGVWGAHQFAVGPQVTVPIFDAGKVRAEVSLAKAQQLEAFETYRRTVLQALHDVENDLNTLQQDADRNRALSSQAQRLEQAFKLQNSLTAAGLGDEMREIDIHRSWLLAEQGELVSRTQLALDDILVYKAMGLAWPEAPETQPTSGIVSR